jgi:hypothetical protein
MKLNKITTVLAITFLTTGQIQFVPNGQDNSTSIASSILGSISIGFNRAEAGCITVNSEGTTYCHFSSDPWGEESDDDERECRDSSWEAFESCIAHNYVTDEECAAEYNRLKSKC